MGKFLYCFIMITLMIIYFKSVVRALNLRGKRIKYQKWQKHLLKQTVVFQPIPVMSFSPVFSPYSKIKLNLKRDV